jgi:hypothetical protein
MPAPEQTEIRVVFLDVGTTREEVRSRPNALIGMAS